MWGGVTAITNTIQYSCYLADIEEQYKEELDETLGECRPPSPIQIIIFRLFLLYQGMSDCLITNKGLFDNPQSSSTRFAAA